VSVYFQVLNRNKRSVTLDLRSPEAPAILDALVARADVVIESFRPQTARRLGVDAATLGARHPRLVHASITGFGRRGPYAERPAHDINYVALAGLFDVDRPADEAPRVPRMLLADVGAALNAAAAVLAALFMRERTGKGSAVDVPIHEAALSWLLFPAARHLVAGGEEDRAELPITGREACYNLYRTADGRHLALGALEPKFWRVFCERIGRPELVARQFTEADDQAALLAEVTAIFAARTAAAWLALFEDEDICLTLVHSVPEALADPHLTARDACERRGGTTFIRMPITFEEHGDAVARIPIEPAPALGADTGAVLAEAGFDEAARARFKAEGLV
jgi:crotonobetainyl-CoA:carnitine CoA-transferase CaiB-like acyl-CoA transferase